jgi:hypothetical protein
MTEESTAQPKNNFGRGRDSNIAPRTPDGYPTALNTSTIDMFRQNRPSEVANALAHLIVSIYPADEPETIRDTRLQASWIACMRILLATGVMKWFNVRRQLIRLKNDLHVRVAGLYAAERKMKELHGQPDADEVAHAKFHYIHGYRRGVEMVYRELKQLCHAPRWSAPDFDKLSKDFVQKYDSYEIMEQMLTAHVQTFEEIAAKAFGERLLKLGQQDAGQDCEGGGNG